MYDHSLLFGKDDFEMNDPNIPILLLLDLIIHLHLLYYDGERFFNLSDYDADSAYFEGLSNELDLGVRL